MKVGHAPASVRVLVQKDPGAGWFWIDIVSIVPYDLVAILVSSRNTGQLKVLRIMRLLRISKLLR
jgi:hypothetical protein